MDEVSVIIPVSEAHLPVFEQAIKSALANGVKGSNISLYWDGNSEDYPRLRWVEQIYKNTYPHTHYGHFPTGVCVARNYLISCRTSGLIVPLDADDTLLPGAIDALTAAYEPGTFVYGNWIERIDTVAVRSNLTPGEITVHKFEPEDIEVKSAPPEMLNRKSVAGCTFLFAKSDWERVGGYDKDFEIGGEDYAFMVALVNAGVRPVRIDVPIYNRTLSDTGRSAKTKARWPMVQALLREKYPDFFPVAREIYERI